MRERQREKATLGGGCFWCLEAVFDEVEGVLDVVSGYAGGKVRQPTYREVCSGLTGHAEAVQVTFDPEIISFEEILRIFFSIHNPTELNRQGADVGTQYRSVVFYHSEAQRETTEKIVEELEKEAIWGSDPIVTEIAPAEPFWPAEDYHQEYFKRNPGQGYCQVVVAPKVAKFRKQFSHRLRS